MSAGMQPVLVHIGFHKTGTTWLQRSVFDAMPGFQQPWGTWDIIRSLIRVHDLEFDVAAARERLVKTRSCDPRPGVVDVVSLERLAGNPHSGGYDSRVLADRVGATFPDARVLIVIREQSRMIVSTYKQYVRVGGARPPGDYLHGLLRGDRVPQFRFSHFAYDLLIAHYQAMLGRERVLVLAYEHLVADPVGFVAAIARFADVEVGGGVRPEARHRSPSWAALALKRRLNLFLVRDELNPAALVSSDRVRQAVRYVTHAVDRRLPPRVRAASDARLRARVTAAIAGRFEESNRRTAALTGLDLAGFGYQMGASAVGDDAGDGKHHGHDEYQRDQPPVA